MVVQEKSTAQQLSQADNADRRGWFRAASRVELEGTGSGNPVAAFAELGISAVAHRLRVWVEDPAALTTGRGRFTIDVPNAKSTKDAVAAVCAFLAQVPGGEAAFKIVTAT
jgi:cytochrome c1